MDFFENIERLKKIDFSLIIYSLLNRIPIIVIGKEVDVIDDLLIELSELMHFRKEFVYYTDFISDEEYQNLLLNESIDYNSQRFHIRCPCNVSLKSLMTFTNFNSWIIGLEIPKERLNQNQFINSLRKKLMDFLIISLLSSQITVELIGSNPKELDLSLENNILQKISDDTEKAVIKMKRILLEKTKNERIDGHLVQSILDFETEKQELKKNIFKKEIQNFFSGSKRAYFILSRLNLLSRLQINTKIGSKTLSETIDYQEVPIRRIIYFIKMEWGEDFSDLIANGKKVNALDSMQSMWG
jgi:hypothetical protein